MATINGKPVNFGFQGAVNADGSSGIVITGVTGVLLQALETTATAGVDKVKNGTGDEVVHAWSNQRKTATVEWILSGSTLAETLTGVSLALKTPGTFVAVTGCTCVPWLVGLSWEVQEGGRISHSNTGAAKVTMPISYCAGGLFLPEGPFPGDRF